MASRHPAPQGTQSLPDPKLLTDYQRQPAANVAEHVDGDALVCLHESLLGLWPAAATPKSPKSPK